MMEQNIQDSSWIGVVKIAGVAAFIQLGYVIMAFGVLSWLGEPPSTVAGWYELLLMDRLRAILLLDAPMIILLAMYYFTGFGVYAVYRRKYEAYMILLTAFVFISVTLAIGTNEVFSLIYLGDQYAPVSSDTIRSQLIAAGEASIGKKSLAYDSGFFCWDTHARLISGILCNHVKGKHFFEENCLYGYTQ